MDLTNSNSVVVPLAAYIAQLYPPSLRQEIEEATPTLVLHARRLGNEVLLAESQGMRFSEAVAHGDFPVMERTYFGAQAMLQYRLPPALRDAVLAMIEHGLNGGFESARKLIFAIAANRDDVDAAMCRFLLWVGVRLNLLLATWDNPAVEARGTLREMEDVAEKMLRELLELPEVILHEQVRPLHLLVAEMLVHMDRHDVTERLRSAMGQCGAELTYIMTSADAIELVRTLDDRHAVLFNPGPFAGQAGSAQIARRYPIQHPSAAALEQTRSRFLKKRRQRLAEAPQDRLIDLIRRHEGADR